MDEINIEIGNRLRDFRKRANLSQQEAGKRLHMTGQALANYENGKRSVSSAMILKCSKLYNVPVSKILGAPDDSKIGEEFWNNLVRSNAETEEKHRKDFEVHIVGDIPKNVYNEIMNFISYIKFKYGYPKK